MEVADSGGRAKGAEPSASEFRSTVLKKLRDNEVKSNKKKRRDKGVGEKKKKEKYKRKKEKIMERNK